MLLGPLRDDLQTITESRVKIIGGAYSFVHTMPLALFLCYLGLCVMICKLLPRVNSYGYSFSLFITPHCVVNMFTRNNNIEQLTRRACYDILSF